MQPVAIEVSLNGPWTRAKQPGIPVTVEEIVREGIDCANAGAAVVHVHAYDVATGRQKDDAEIYAAIIEGIRARTDAIVYPTIPLAGFSGASTLMSANARFAHIETLAQRGLIEWAVVDPGSVNICERARLAEQESGFTYLNPEEHVRHALRIADRYGFSPSYAIYEPGFLRLGAFLAGHYPRLGKPIYRFMFSDGFTFGFPPAPWALEAYLQLLSAEAAGGMWMVAGLNVDITPLLVEAATRGGGVRVGLEDAPLGDPRSNLQWVEHAVRVISHAGREPATPQHLRAVLARSSGEPKPR
jgi:3-keto-5-aminohexanoate cleavage enzyme